MTRFVYLTDTHIGADSLGFYQQPAYPQHAELLLSALREEIRALSPDFVIHGGDLADSCDPDVVRRAAGMLDFGVPVGLCLGNHDLDRPDALRIWLDNAPGLFPGGTPNFSFETDDCVVHVVPNHWEPGKEYYWHRKLDPYFSEQQLRRLEQALADRPDKIHLLVTHSPVFGMSPEQSGLDEVIHDPPESFRQAVVRLTERHPNLKAVFSGHSHLNTLKTTAAGVYATTSAFIETPFEYKVVDVTRTSLSIRTQRLSLPAAAGFAPEYDEAKSYAQGRPQDRECKLEFS